MKFVVVLLVASAVVSGCGEMPPPATGPMIATCEDRFTESACKEGRRCRWVNEYKRADGTTTTARCSAS
jgi:hypothetical protein